MDSEMLWHRRQQTSKKPQLSQPKRWSRDLTWLEARKLKRAKPSMLIVTVRVQSSLARKTRQKRGRTSRMINLHHLKRKKNPNKSLSRPWKLPRHQRNRRCLVLTMTMMTTRLRARPARVSIRHLRHRERKALQTAS